MKLFGKEYDDATADLYKFISCVLNLTCFYIKMSSLTRNCLVPSPTRSNGGPINFLQRKTLVFNSEVFISHHFGKKVIEQKV